MKFIPTQRIFRYSLMFYITSVLISCGTAKWESTAPDDTQMLADISFLASNRLKGRTFGSEGEMTAGEYISQRFTQLGLQPKGENGTWFQSLTVK
ncbi:MAG: hypothetical protein ABIQ02_16405, partial [Saprospiraceae bacterium]